MVAQSKLKGGLMRVTTTLAAALVVLAMQAQAQDADYYVDRLWKAMGGVVLQTWTSRN